MFIKPIIFTVLQALFFSTFAVFSTHANDHLIPKTNNIYLDALPSWQEVLIHHVDDQGRVNFKGLSSNMKNLNTFVAVIEKISPQTHPKKFPTAEETMAYHINAYNALAMKGVIERNIPKNFGSFFKRASFFKLRKVTIGGEETSLHAYENNIIRRLNEPRSHFALNCMVRDCPRLPRKVFTAENLEKMLEEVSVEFFNKDKHLLIDDEKRLIKVSSILKFYTEDFVSSGKAKDLIPYINRFRSEKIPENYAVKYIKYDWTINKQP